MVTRPDRGSGFVSSIGESDPRVVSTLSAGRQINNPPAINNSWWKGREERRVERVRAGYRNRCGSIRDRPTRSLFNFIFQFSYLPSFFRDDFLCSLCSININVFRRMEEWNEIKWNTGKCVFDRKSDNQVTFSVNWISVDIATSGVVDKYIGTIHNDLFDSLWVLER